MKIKRVTIYKCGIINYYHKKFTIKVLIFDDYVDVAGEYSTLNECKDKIDELIKKCEINDRKLTQFK